MTPPTLSGDSSNPQPGLSSSQRPDRRSLHELAEVLSAPAKGGAKNRIRRLFIALLSIVSIGLALFFILRPAPIPVVSSPVAYQRSGPIAQTTYRTAGSVEYAMTSHLRSKSPTPLLTLDVTTGQRVQAGQRLALFDDAELRIRLEGVLEQIQLRQELLERAERRREIGSETDESILILQAEVESLRNQRDLLRQQIRDQRLVAPFDGTVLRIDLSPGEIPSGGVILIGRSDSVLVRSDIPQDDKSRIIPHQPAIVILDAFPQMQFAARVVDLQPMGDQARNTFEVLVQVLSPDASVMPGFSGRVYFTTTPLHSNTPVQTRLALHREFIEISREEVGTDTVRQGRVWTLDEGKAKPVIVRLGEEFGEYIEILEGLEEGRLAVRAESGLELRKGIRIRRQ